MLIEAFHLLAYFASVSSRVVPALRDRAMNYTVNLGFDQEKYAPGVPRDSKAWLDCLIPRDYRSVLTGRNLEGPSGGAGVAPPSPDRVLELDHVGLWMTLHARPGTVNFVHGIVMNHAFGIVTTLTSLTQVATKRQRLEGEKGIIYRLLLQHTCIFCCYSGQFSFLHHRIWTR
jgi:hypothetical protein